MTAPLPLRPASTAALALMLSLLTACGGGGSAQTSSSSGGSPPAGSGDTVLQASSAGSSALIQWQGQEANTTWTLQRRREGAGTYTDVTTLAGASGLHADVGLDSGARYEYRLVDARGTVVAETTAETGSDELLNEPPGALQGTGQSFAVGPQAARLVAGDGALVVRVPAGSFAAAGTVTGQARAQSLADGVGAAWSLQLPAVPSQPLTVSLQYGADEDVDDVLNQRLAVRLADGTWWLLALSAHDAATRTLSAVVPPGLAAASAPPTTTVQALARPSAGVTKRDASGRIELTFVRLVALKLKPAVASVGVLGSVTLTPVAAWEVKEEDCMLAGVGALCVPRPGLKTREFPILNDKPGYTRRWQVEGSDSPPPTLGSLAPVSPAGVVYTAPATLPSPNPVRVQFDSTHAASGRHIRLTARIRVAEDAWIGPMYMNNTADGLGYYFTADTRWVLDPDRSTNEVRRYRAQGRTALQIVNPQCPLTPTPAGVDLGPAAGVSDLVIDERSGTYEIQLNATWSTVLNNCHGVPMPTAVGAIWNETGGLTDGRIRGAREAGSLSWVWNLTRP